MTETIISHALVIPDDNFTAWLSAVRPYTQAFERVAVIRSPRGNDLNRYRHVTAVNAPLTWMNNDPLRHIRRIYPMVVRVDTIRANTPQELMPILQRRITNKDRYGERENTPLHIFDRFVLDYPVQFSPMRISDAFDDLASAAANFGINIGAARGAVVIAAAAGVVSFVGTSLAGVSVGNCVTVSTLHEGKSYRVSYTMLESVGVRVGQAVALGAPLGTCANNSMRVVLQEAITGGRGYALPEVLDPGKALYVTNLRVRPKDKNVRIRTTPSLEGEIVTQINPWELVESLEMHGRTLAKVGRDDQWLRVKAPDGQTGYSAAWFLDATIKTPNSTADINPVGVNLDFLHPQGIPPANRLGNCGWVRLGYNVSQAVAGRAGSTDIVAAYNRYAPIVERYTRAGYKVIMTTSHQTYGEGAGYVWPAMTEAQWTQLIDRFAQMMYSITRQWAGKGLLEVWQVWNEPDSHAGAHASVPLTWQTYQQMLRKVVPAMRAGDPDAVVLTAGYTGTQSGDQYARLSLKGLPADAIPDGVSIHPYGRDVEPGTPFGIFGRIDEVLRAYLSVLPGKPVWITEWGILNAPQVPAVQVGNYTRRMISHIKTNYGDQVAALVWYAWAEGMHDGYGIVDRNQQPRVGLTDYFLNA